MAEEKKVVTLDDFEQRLMVSGLMDFRNDLLRDEKPTEDINDLILKAIDAPTKKEKRTADREARYALQAECDPLSLRHNSGCVARPVDRSLLKGWIARTGSAVRIGDAKPIPDTAL